MFQTAGGLLPVWQRQSPTSVLIQAKRSRCPGVVSSVRYRNWVCLRSALFFLGPPFALLQVRTRPLKRYSHFRRSLTSRARQSSPRPPTKERRPTIFTLAAASSTVTDDLGPTSTESRTLPQDTHQDQRRHEIWATFHNRFDKVGAQHRRSPSEAAQRTVRIRHVHLPVRLPRPTRAVNPLAFDLAARAATVSQPCLRGTLARLRAI